jgi:long-chain acyl-CoA synthetase
MSQLLEQLRTGSVEALALIEESTRWTRGELIEKVQRLASRLPIAPGDRVALFYSNQKEFFVGFYAVRQRGGVVVPINLQLPKEDIGYVLQHSGARLILADAELSKPLMGLPHLWISGPEWDAEGDPQYTETAATNTNDLAVLLYTSGTTGVPKGVMLSEHNLLTNLDGIAQVFDFTEQDRILVALPLFHAFGLIIALYALRVQAAVVLSPKFSPQAMLTALIEEKVTVLPLVPTLFSLLVQGAQKLGGQPFAHLRYCISGGATLPPELLARIEAALGCPVLEGYGLTETSPVVSVNRPKDGSFAGSVGAALPNVQVRFLNDDNTWSENGPGEICVKADSVMLGYYQMPDATAEIMTPDGWLKTGDLGHLDEAGRLFISGGRKKDIIIKAGENIAPLSIERVLYQHPAIQEASVIGVPHPRLGESVLACVQLRDALPAPTEQELKAFCREHLSAFLTPDAFRIYPELPKNAAGKVLKKALRAENPTLKVALVEG